MKRIIYTLLISLLLIPTIVLAATANDSFDPDTCTLTISGEFVGHDASVSLFTKSGEFKGMNTSEIVGGNYSVSFVLTYDEETTLDATIANQAGQNEFNKEDIVVPACELPEPAVDRIDTISDGEGNTLTILNKTSSFNVGDYLHIEMITDFSSLSEEDQATFAAIQDKLGKTNVIYAAMMVSVRNGNNEVGIPETKAGYKLLINQPREAIEGFNKPNMVRLVGENTIEFEAPIRLTYDNGIVAKINGLGVYIIYDDTLIDYDFLDNTDDQTYYVGVDKSLTLKINALLEKFKSVYIDGKEVSSKNYTTKSGSTIITFKKTYLDKLAEGTHEVVVNFTDGTASTTLTIDKSKNPKTGDNIIMWVSILAVSGAVITSIKITSKKRKSNAN